MLRRIFVLMLENRSFDHMLGFSGISGWDPAKKANRPIDGADPLLHFNYVDPRDPSSRKVHVSRGGSDRLTRSEKDPGHEFDHTLIDLCGPDAGMEYQRLKKYPAIDNSGFVYKYVQQGSSAPDKVMEVFDPNQIPNLTRLGSSYAVCDQWYSSMPGPTWPNRFFVHAGTSGGLDDSPSTFDAMLGELAVGYEFPMGTIFDRLDQAQVEWVIYEGDSWPQAFAIKGMGRQWRKGRFRDYKYFERDISSADFQPRYIFIEPDYGRTILPPWDFSGGTSQHPLDSVASGETLIHEVYSALKQSPHWEESALVITYDEHGGFYDHVPPPPAVPTGDDRRYSTNMFTFDQYGVRVPTVIVSPLLQKPMVDGTRYDHTSILRTIELLFGLAPLTDRDAGARDFLHLFPSTMLYRSLFNRLPRGSLSRYAEELSRTLGTIMPVPGTRSRAERVRGVRTEQRDSSPPEDLSPGLRAEESGRPLSPRVRGFLHVAFLRDLELQRDLSPFVAEDLRSRVMAIRTIGQADEYMEEVRRRVEAFKEQAQRPGQMDRRLE